MKKYIKEIILLLIQLFMFYVFPLFAGPTDAMGMVVIIILITSILSLTLGIISKEKLKYLYPIIVSILFIPTIFIYYNISALIHSVWYLVISFVGMLLGISIKKIVKYKKVLLTLIIIITIGIVIFVFVTNNKPLQYKDIVTIKIGKELPLIQAYFDENEIKRLDDDKIEWENIKLEDNKIYISGKYKGYVKYKNKNIELVLEVIDDEKPVIEGVQDITIYVNEEIDLLKNITTSDNSHDDISLNIIGEYNTSTVGEYALSYIATDKSGNETIKDFKLIVKEKEVPKVNTNITENVTIGTTSKGYTIKRINGIYYVNNILIANKTYALPSSYAPGGLLNTFMNAFNSMQTDAAIQGISLSIISGYRSYSTQYSLYNNYVNRDGKALADTYSARAGHSEHQTGLAADINSLNQSWISTPEGTWLNNNCYKYGFIIRYPKGKENITGYMYEPWHIRYVGVDVATILYNNGNWISLEEYLGITSSYNY